MRPLLSGAGGFLGDALLRRLPDGAVCLLRGSDHAARAATLARRSGVPVAGVSGDVRAPRWGLDDGLDALRGEVDSVVHLASETSWSAPWERLQHVNVDGAEEAVHVAARLGVPLIHASSLFSARSDHDVVPEALVPEHPDLSDYERSKCRAEWVVADAARRAGVPVRIARIGGLLGDHVPTPGRRSVPKVPMVRLLVTSGWPWVPYVRGARLDVAPRDLVAARLLELCDEAPTGAVDVLNVGLGMAAPLVGSLLAEASARTADGPNPVPRPMPAPAWVLRRASAGADRVGLGPGAARTIGLRYLSSSTLYPGRGNLEAVLPIGDLVTAMGFPPPSTPALPGYYAPWLTSSS